MPHLSCNGAEAYYSSNDVPSTSSNHASPIVRDEGALMPEPLRLMCVLAHPDDESLGTGGTLAKYAAEGVETYLVVATRGERGWTGEPRANPGLATLGRIRAAELRAAARVLGIRRVDFLDYVDGDLDRAEPAAVIGKIAAYLRAVRPQVVVTFGPEGAYGHPDHIAICQFTTAAVAAAGGDGALPDVNQDGAPHRVAKLYYKVWTAAEGAAYEAVFGEIRMPVDGVDRAAAPWPDWAITTRLDTARYWPTVWQAISCHRSQLPNYAALAHLPPARHERLWGSQGFYRALSLVNGGRAIEDDLFAGLR